MPLILLALLGSIVFAIAGLVFLVVRGIEFFRLTRVFSGALAIELEVLANSLERLNAYQPADTERVGTAFARLESSKQRLEVLTGALGRVQQQWGGVLATYPKK